MRMLMKKALAVMMILSLLFGCPVILSSVGRAKASGFADSNSELIGTWKMTSGNFRIGDIFSGLYVFSEDQDCFLEFRADGFVHILGDCTTDGMLGPSDYYMDDDHVYTLEGDELIIEYETARTVCIISISQDELRLKGRDSRAVFHRLQTGSNGPTVQEEEPENNTIPENQTEDVYSGNNDNSGMDLFFRHDTMQNLLEDIHIACFEYVIVQFDHLCPEEDQSTVRAIAQMRNDALEGKCTPEEFVIEFARYGYGNDTIFNNQRVKGYGHLSFISQYIILEMGRWMIELCPDIHFMVEANYFDYDIITDSYDYMIDYSYDHLLS